MSIIEAWELLEFNKWDKQCSKEDDYNRAVEMEIEAIKENIANCDDDVICVFREKMLDYDDVINTFDDNTFNDDEFIKAVALGTDYEEMRIKILTAMAEDRLEQLEEDYRKGYILND
ncbi:MAG: hypothetical protein E7K21_01910 [Haemophilus parainfluenzae]|nr:hypothetical protein [Haemophilus parainfluenzae]